MLGIGARASKSLIGTFKTCEDIDATACYSPLKGSIWRRFGKMAFFLEKLDGTLDYVHLKYAFAGDTEGLWQNAIR